jgi:hypothetical protein
MGTGAFSVGETILGCEVDHPPLPSADVKDLWSCTSTPPYAITMSCFINHRLIHILFKDAFSIVKVVVVKRPLRGCWAVLDFREYVLITRVI